MPGWMTKNKTPKKHNSSKTPILRKGDVPATQNMLFKVRDQLREEIHSVRHELKQDIVRLDGKIDSLEHKMLAGFHEIKSEIHRLGVIFEEQNARNAVVLDGYASLFERQERVEKKLDGEI